MKLLLRQARIIDPCSSHHQQITDLYLEDKRIVDIAPSLEKEGAMVIDLKGICIAPAWVDIGVTVGDPGFEQREDIGSLSRSAARGGFTSVAVFPNTQPVVDSKAGVEYFIRRTSGELVELLPIGAVSEQGAGRNITEMIDMKQAGAVAFSDGLRPIQDNGLMLRALQYVLAFDGLILNQPQDLELSLEGQMHEGRISTVLGMKGIPSLAESIMVQRDIRLLEYSGSRLHLGPVSAGESLAIIRKAKEKGLSLTCSVDPLHLNFTAAELEGYDTNFKVNPPLRSESDRQQLLQACREGVVDLISSNHRPWEEEAKKLEFPYAEFGAIGLETSYALANTALGEQMDQEEIIACFSQSPRRILNLPELKVEVGMPATLTLFDPNEVWSLEASFIASRSRNTPLLGRELKGRVKGVIHNGKSEFFELR